jgi:Flp pilus assembly protein TadD
LAFDFEKALPDLARTLAIQPRHLGALSGKGLTHLALGQEALAEIEFRKVLALNPFTPDQDLIQDLGTDL